LVFVDTIGKAPYVEFLCHLASPLYWFSFGFESNRQDIGRISLVIRLTRN
jgi:hypothetical protein